MNSIGIIPARIASSRFPGKPLVRICGIPMIGHVFFRSKMCKSLSEVYVATCDEEIAEYINSINGKAILTSNTHERASDRTAEAMLKIERRTNDKIDIVVMIQGDEPMVMPEMIDLAVKPLLEDEGISVVNLMGGISSREEHEDPNLIKVVVDNNNFALYFSREPIPSRKKGADDVIMLKQICVIPFRRDFLLSFNNLAPTILEKIESIDMLRILGHGYKVKMVFSSFETYSVDTLQDLKRVEKLMLNDALLPKYK